MTIPAGPLGRVVRLRGLDGDAALVLRRAKDFADQHVRDALGVMPRIDNEQVNRAHEPAGPDGRPESEHRPADDLAPRFGDEDRGLGQEDQLAQEVRGVERACGIASAEGAQGLVAKCNEPIDVRDTCCPDRVLQRRRVEPRDAGDAG